MGKKLNTNVHVADDDGQMHVFGPGDEVPAWAEKAITNPTVWEGAEPEPAKPADPGNSGVAPVEGSEVEPAEEPAEPRQRRRS